MLILYVSLWLFPYFVVPLCIVNRKDMAIKKLNRLKIVLAEKDKSNNWLAEQLCRDKTTVSKWCTNTCQPDIETFMKISKLLNVDVSELLRMDEIKCETNK